ncbi:site-specific DNA-methyltransferase [bacterium]|nr:site-specific DNA-methyltransferase [bacterium]
MRVIAGRRPLNTIYQTSMGRMLAGSSEKVLQKPYMRRFRSQVDLIFTSPPFPLLRKKAYGNLQGNDYSVWLASFGSLFHELLSDSGSLVVEIGNVWNPGSPTWSTIPLKALLSLQESMGFHLCQEFIYFNTAKLPSPAQWVNIERIRVKDSFTRLWWLSKTERPKADNRNVQIMYSKSMKQLLKRGSYNAGKRPSQHDIGKESFLQDNGGAIPPNVLSLANTNSSDSYRRYCRNHSLQPHPAKMPPKVVEFFINFLTDENDIVLDPFAGSNTTGIVAEVLNRQWISVEREMDYIAGSIGHFDNDGFNRKLVGRIAT